MAPKDVVGSKMFVKLNLGVTTDLQKLADLKIPVFENYGNSILTFTDRDGLELLKDNAVPYQVLDAQPMLPGT